MTHASRKGKVFDGAREVLEFGDALCVKKKGEKETFLMVRERFLSLAMPCV
jgi:hypothetical protein